MTEKRAQDVETGDLIRLDPDDPYGQVINADQRGDDVLLTVAYSKEINPFPVDLPVLDCDEVVEVLT